MSPHFRVILILAVAFICSVVLVRSDRNKIDFNYLRALSVAFPFIDLSFSIGQVGITPYLLISLVYITLRIRLLSWFVKRVPVLILIGIMAVTTIASQFELISILAVFQRLLFLTPIVAAYSTFLSREVSKTLYTLILPPVLYTLFFALIQLLIDPHFSLYYSVWSKEERLSFCYRDPQVAGCVIATFMILLFNLFLKSKKLSYLVLFILLFPLGCLTGSKTFLIGVTLALALSLLRNNFSIKSIFIIGLFILTLLLTYNFWSELPAFQRMTVLDESLEGRRDVCWLGAWKIFLDNPYFGIGPGSFHSYAEKYNLPMRHWIDGEFVYASQPESGYLLWLDEYGIFSFGLIFLLIYVFSRKGVTSLNNCSLIPWAVCFVSLYNILYTHIPVLLAIMVGAIFAVHKRTSSYSLHNRYK